MNLAFAFVFLFIFKIKFKGTNFSDVLREKYGGSGLQNYRRCEKLNFKILKLKADIKFLEKCKAYSILPKFLKFKLYRHSLSKTSIYKSFQFKLLNLELKQKRKNLKKCQEDYKQTLEKFKKQITWLDYHCLKSRFLDNNNSKIKSVESVHTKKLINLGIPCGHAVDKSKVVINLSRRNLSTDEKDALAFGLSFGLSKQKVNVIKHYFAFEKFLHTVKKTVGVNFKSFQQAISGIAHSSLKEFENFKHSFPKLPLNLYEALISLSKDKSIIITRPDKGRGTVILNKSDYISKVTSILSDESKFKQLTEPVAKYITKMEDKLMRLLRKLLNNKVITKDTYNYVSPSGSSPGILYGLPKVHKKECPMRPILNTIGTFNYNLAKFFVPIIEPVTTNQFTLKNSYEFVKELSDLKIPNGVMASFDVVSLFTNIPLDETIEIITEELFQNSNDFQGFSKEQFSELLTLATKDSPFIFDDKVYTQVDGVSMGSCLGPTFANAFLCYHEKKWLDECPTMYKPLYYRRYVDDTFLIFNDASHMPKFLSYLNNKHVNIKFTSESEDNGTISFLDVKVTRGRGSYCTSVYRKPTFTGLGTSYLSFVPSVFKVNAMKTLIHRCYNISSNWTIFDEEIKFLKKFLYE